MDKKDLERRLEAAEKQNIGLLDEIKNLKVKLAEMKDEPEIPEFPKFERGDTYWYANEEFELHKGSHSGYVGENGDDDLYNAFHTEAYAKEFAKMCKLIAVMLHCKWYFDREYVPDWKNSDENKYFVFYNNYENGFVVTGRTWSDIGFVAISNEESARKCADWLNEHWRVNDADRKDN